MYIRKSSRTHKGKTYFNYVLVESVLTPLGPPQKVICSLGDLRPRPQAEWLALAHKLTSALSGQADLLTGQAPDPELQALVAKVQSAHPPSVAADSRRFDSESQLQSRLQLPRRADAGDHAELVGI